MCRWLGSWAPIQVGAWVCVGWGWVCSWLAGWLAGWLAVLSPAPGLMPAQAPNELAAAPRFASRTLRPQASSNAPPRPVPRHPCPCLHRWSWAARTPPLCARMLTWRPPPGTSPRAPSATAGSGARVGGAGWAQHVDGLGLGACRCASARPPPQASARAEPTPGIACRSTPLRCASVSRLPLQAPLPLQSHQPPCCPCSPRLASPAPAAVKVVLVHEAVADELVPRVLAAVKKMSVGM